MEKRLLGAASASSGSSVARIDGYLKNYVVERNGSETTVTSKFDGQATRYPNSITALRFVDGQLDFDIDGVAGQVYRLYRAAFGREPDVQGLGYWIAAARNGVSLETIATQFLSSNEFSALYGRELTATTFINAVYRNVLQREPDGGGLQWWVNSLDSGADRASVLNGFSESTENRKAVDPTIIRGFSYVLPRLASDPILPKPTSYENAKETGLKPFSLPREAEWSAAYARADFLGNGTLSLFAAWRTYDNSKPLEAATPGSMAFFTVNADGSYTKHPAMINTSVSCIEPRKAVLADFNADGKPDVLLACTGYDNTPFPGERMMLVESTPAGSYNAHFIGDFIGFFHGAAAADLDHDGLVDIVATDGGRIPNHAVRTFRNLGNGQFSEVLTVLPPQVPTTGLFSLELLDLDEDGNIDMLVGGHESEGYATYAIYGNGSMSFTSAGVQLLPSIKDAGVVLDFVKVGKKLYVGRTNGGATGSYSALGLQTIDLTTMTTIDMKLKTSLLFYWLIPGEGGVVSDRLDRPL